MLRTDHSLGGGNPTSDSKRLDICAIREANISQFSAIHTQDGCRRQGEILAEVEEDRKEDSHVINFQPSVESLGALRKAQNVIRDTKRPVSLTGIDPVPKEKKKRKNVMKKIRKIWATATTTLSIHRPRLFFFHIFNFFSRLPQDPQRETSTKVS